MSRPKTVYRGKRKYGWLITLGLSVLILLFVGGIWMFYDLQRYIVYDRDGLHLDLSGEETLVSADAAQSNTGKLAHQHVNVELVVEQKDYSGATTSAGQSLSSIHAIRIAAKDVTEATLRYYAASMGNFNALVLEMKGPDGFLSWHSSVSMSDSFAVNGTAELWDSLAALKENGVYLVAELGSLVDAAMGQRNSPISLKNAATGSALSDNNGRIYLDPYNEKVRAYLKDLIAELKDMGFDEVLLAGFSCPDSSDLQFSLTMTQAPSPSAALSSLAMWLREQADSIGICLSAIIEPDSLRSETVLCGQDPALMFKAFDRLAVETDYDHLSGDATALLLAMDGSDQNRAVLITEDFTPERESYIVK